ncbi:hypothetical protein HPB50_015482 [Hyalomma asiaticum]|uniref:Uncharacterized protein n=1 Tax=Hyalomma asiaticum TaxID=266040 RepID=A0ACB7RM94_HYAAI|nr:hypothetical protein HPB50_015482 [Hyalomma asiaticum]
MAYSAYHKLAKNESQPHSAGFTGIETPSSVIPTLGLGYTGEVHDAEQLFFAAYCLQLCGTVVSRNMTGSLPLNVRCNLPLREVPEFGRAFNCPSGSPMVSRDTCL